MNKETFAEGFMDELEKIGLSGAFYAKLFKRLYTPAKGLKGLKDLPYKMFLGRLGRMGKVMPKTRMHKGIRSILKPTGVPLKDVGKLWGV